MNQEIGRHNFEQESKLRNMETHKPKDYWKYINNKQATCHQLKTCLNYYNRINNTDKYDDSDAFLKYPNFCR